MIFRIIHIISLLFKWVDLNERPLGNGYVIINRCTASGFSPKLETVGSRRSGVETVVNKALLAKYSQKHVSKLKQAGGLVKTGVARGPTDDDVPRELTAFRREISVCAVPREYRYCAFHGAARRGGCKYATTIDRGRFYTNFFIPGFFFSTGLLSGSL